MTNLARSSLALALPALFGAAKSCALVNLFVICPRWSASGQPTTTRFCFWSRPSHGLFIRASGGLPARDGGHLPSDHDVRGPSKAYAPLLRTSKRKWGSALARRGGRVVCRYAKGLLRASGTEYRRTSSER